MKHLKLLLTLAAILFGYGKPAFSQTLDFPSVILSNVPFEMTWEGFTEASPGNPVIVRGFADTPFYITSPMGEADVKILGNAVLEFTLD